MFVTIVTKRNILLYFKNICLKYSIANNSQLRVYFVLGYEQDTCILNSQHMLLERFQQ